MSLNRQQQEMVERSESSSPFWRNRHSVPSNSDSSRRPDSSKIVGAAYSHADVLKLESLSVSNSPRPKTPPTAPSQSATSPRAYSSKSRPAQGFKPRGSYHRFLSNTSADSLDSENGDEEDVSGDFEYDQDEDEFGLPSIAAARRKKSQRRRNGIGPKMAPTLATNGHLSKTAMNGPKLDSGDIAEERSLPNYPSTTNKTQGKILRPQYKDILRDPANSLHLIDHPPPPSGSSPKEVEDHAARISRINKFKRILQASTISFPELRDSAWSGLPQEVRAMSWQVLLGYLPTNSERRVITLEKKRKEYLDGVRQAFDRAGFGGDKLQKSSTGASGGHKSRGRGLDEAIWHQISIDVPRTNPHLELYAYEATQRSLERILYVWAIRHPASGYVQGINDLVTPFWQVFLSSYITDADIESGMDPAQLPKPVLDAVEADSFWCLSKLLDGIQDNYVHAQPGIQRQVASLRDLTKRIDATLVGHLEREGVEFMQFSFRWMNCLLMREVSVQNVIRMWDTYLSEDRGFSEFHLYVCAAFLVKWSDQLLKMDFQEILVFLQSLPTRNWSVKDMELLLSEAYIWQTLFQGSSAHLKDASGASTPNLGAG
ncbi:MAG: GTPase-activating protein [Alyxoria varia]|nr:MAG: GTPase-activating protein [Alyxoria varia]